MSTARACRVEPQNLMVLQRAFEHEIEVPEGFQVVGGAAVGLLKVRQRMLGRMMQSASREGKCWIYPCKEVAVSIVGVRFVAAGVDPTLCWKQPLTGVENRWRYLTQEKN